MHRCNENLPPCYSKHLEIESKESSKELKELIQLMKQNDAASNIQARNIQKITTHLNLKYEISESIRVELIYGLERFIFDSSPSPMIHIKKKALIALSNLLKRSWKHPNVSSQIHLSWKKPYEIIDQRYFGRSRQLPNCSSGLDDEFCSALVKYVAASRKYFPQNAATEIWECVKEKLKDVHSNDSFEAMGKLSCFFPPHADCSQYIVIWIEIWGRVSHCPQWDSHWLLLFSRAAKHSKNIDWSPHLDFLFNQIKETLGLRGGTGKSPEKRSWPSSHKIFDKGNNLASKSINRASKLCVYLLHDTSMMTRLMDLFASVQTLYHPSNSSSYTKLGAFLRAITAYIAKRLGKESVGDEENKCVNLSSSPKLPHLLTTLFDINMLALYSKNTSMSVNSCNSIAQLTVIRPQWVCTRLLERMGSALSAIDQTHQAPTAISALTLVLSPLLHPKPYIAPYLSSLLSLTLPGIDPNDSNKTRNTLILYCMILDWIPLIDGTTNEMVSRNKTDDGVNTLYVCEQLDSECSDEASLLNEAWRASSILGDWAIALLERLFSVIKNRDLPSNSIGIAEVWDSKLLIGATDRLFMQMSPEIYKLCLRKTLDFVQSSFDVNIGKDVAYLLASCTHANPKLSLDLFIPYFLKKLSIKDLRSGKINSESIPSTEIEWYLRLIDGIVRKSGNELLKYSEDIEFCISTFVSHEKKRVRKIAGKLLRHTLISLLHIYPVELRSLPPRMWLDGQATQHWGHCNDWKSLDISWHEPSELEFSFAMKLIKTHLLKSISSIQELIQSNSIAVTSWKCKLREILNSVRGAAVAMYNPEIVNRESYIKCYSYSSNQDWDSIRRKVILMLHESITYWLTVVDRTRDTKCLDMILQISKYILGSRGGLIKKSTIKQSIHNMHKQMFRDYASLSRRKELLIKENNVMDKTLQFGLSRRWMIEHVTFQQEKRLVEASYCYPRMEFYPKKSSISEPLELLLSDLVKLSMYRYSSVRILAQKLVEPVFSRYPWVFRSFVPKLIDNLLDPKISREIATGSIYLLKDKRSSRIISTNYEIQLKFIGMLCSSHELVKNMEVDHQEKIQKRLNELHLSYNKFWQHSVLIYNSNSIDLSSILDSGSTDHWRYEFLQLSCILWYIRSDNDEVSKTVWKRVFYGIQSNVHPIQKLSLSILSRLMIKRKVSNNDSPQFSLEDWRASEMKSKEFLHALFEGLRNDHRIALLSADGQSADSSPKLWSTGITDMFRESTRNFKAFPPSRHPFTSKNFNIHHSQLAKGLFEVLGYQFLEASTESLTKLLNCHNEERRASLCALSEIISGVLRGATRKKNLNELQDKVWDFVMPYIETSLKTISLEWCTDWVDFIRFCSSKRSAEVLKPLIHFILEQLSYSLRTSNMDDYASQAKWLKIVQGILIEGLTHSSTRSSHLKWIKKLIPCLLSAIGHPFKAVREEVGRTLFILFVEGNMEDAEPIDETILTNSNDIKLLLQEKNFEVKDIVDNHKRETILYLIIHSVYAGDVSKYSNLVIQLAPVAFYTQCHPDMELSALSKHCISVMSQGMRLIQQNASSNLVKLLQLIELISTSKYWRVREAVLNFISGFVAYHRFALSLDQRNQIHQIVLKLLSDPQREIQTLAKQVLTGLLTLENLDTVQEIAKDFLHESKQTRKKKKHASLSKNSEAISSQSFAVIGLSAVILAYPYTVPDFIPLYLSELSFHINSPAYLNQIVKKTILDFKRTHQDNWQEHKQKFTYDQLEDLNGLLIAPDHYA